MQMQLGACSHVLKLKLMFLNAMIYFQRAGEAAWPGLAVLSLDGTGSIWPSTSAVWWKRGWRSWRSWLWCEAWETAQAAEKNAREDPAIFVAGRALIPPRHGAALRQRLYRPPAQLPDVHPPPPLPQWVCVAWWHLVSVRTFRVMYDYTFSKITNHQMKH